MELGARFEPLRTGVPSALKMKWKRPQIALNTGTAWNVLPKIRKILLAPTLSTLSTHVDPHVENQRYPGTRQEPLETSASKVSPYRKHLHPYIARWLHILMTPLHLKA